LHRRRHGALRFDDEQCDVFYNAQAAGLTRSEYRLLETLNRNDEEVLSKAFLYQHVLQRGYAAHDRSLDMHISQIRRKLKAIGYTEREVRTVWGKGYVLSAPMKVSDLPGRHSLFWKLACLLVAFCLLMIWLSWSWGRYMEERNQFLSDEARGTLSRYAGEAERAWQHGERDGVDNWLQSMGCARRPGSG
jgi:DNA-binding winged helix-turn-helix (wHTH) protein